VSSAIHASSSVRAVGVQSGLASAGGRRPARHVGDAAGGGGEDGGRGAAGQAHQWGVRTTSGWSNRGWWGGGRGRRRPGRSRPAVRDSRAARAASRSSRPPRPQLTRIAPGGPGPAARRRRGGRWPRSEGRAASARRWPRQLAQVRAVDLGRRRLIGSWASTRMPNARGQLADPPADPPVADDPDGGPVQVADATPARSAQRPSRTSRVSGPSRLTRCSAWASTPSATARCRRRG
jgi:hypothetical protein